MVPVLSGSTAGEAGASDGFITTPDGVGIHVLAAGQADAPALLFVPGWTMSARIWRSQLVHFAAAYRAVAMDPRGQGDSDRPREGMFPAARARDIAAVIGALRLAPVVLVGWSMAVAEVGSYLEQFGTSGVRAIVLVDGILGADRAPGEERAMVDWAAAFEADRRGATERFCRSMFRKPIREAEMQQIVDDALKTPTDAAVALFLASLAADFRRVAPLIDRPTLICVSPGPHLPDHLETAKAIRGARLEVFEDAGHALFLDDSTRFNARLDEFLAGGGPSPPGNRR